MSAIRYAVAGLGRAGWDIHIDQLRRRDDARIVAVVDAVPQRLEQATAEFGCTTYRDFAPMLAKKDVEVVIIATPSAQHAPQTIAALKAKKHVIVEKPMALSVAQADRMIAAARGARRKLFVHQNYRFFPLAGHLRETIDSGVLGRLYHVRACVSCFARRDDWQTLVKNGGGVLNNTGSHYLDLILQLMGAPVRQVMGDLRRIASAGDAEDHVKALLRAENGVTADLEISNAQNVASLQPRWVLCGTHGTLTCNGEKSIIRWFDPRAVKSLRALDAAAAGRTYGNDDQIPWQEKTVPAESPVTESFYDNVYNVLRRGKGMIVTPQSVRQVLGAIELIRRGTKFDGKITRAKPGRGAAKPRR